MTGDDVRDCDICGKPFVQDEDWKRLCVACWKEAKGYKMGVGDQAFVLMRDAYIHLDELSTASLERLETRVKELETDLEKATADLAKTRQARSKAVRAYKALRAKKGTAKTVEDARGPVLSEKRIKALLKLAHPDRHGGSTLATEVTKWLLKLREKTD